MESCTWRLGLQRRNRLGYTLCGTPIDDHLGPVLGKPRGDRFADAGG